MKIDNILFPVDFSGPSLALNAEVEWLASHCNARVTLLHVTEIPAAWYGGGEVALLTGEDFRAYLEADRRRLQEYAIDVPADRLERVSAEGSAAGRIAMWAQEHEVDLIVMGTHGHGPVRRLLLGSVAMKVLHDVECPVWTHPAASEGKRLPGIGNILCALELSEEAVPLLRFAREAAATFGATAHVVHCVPESPSRMVRYLDSDLHRSLKFMAQQEIASLQQQAGTNFPLHITEHDIANDIAGLAAEWRADLIVIGRGRAQNVFGPLRTHAAEIIRQAPCPVLSFSMEQAKRDMSRRAEAAAAQAMR